MCNGNKYKQSTPFANHWSKILDAAIQDKIVPTCGGLWSDGIGGKERQWQYDLLYSYILLVNEASIVATTVTFQSHAANNQLIGIMLNNTVIIYRCVQSEIACMTHFQL